MAYVFSHGFYILLSFKAVPVLFFFNWASRHEGVLGEWGIAPIILWPRYLMEVSGQLHTPVALSPGKKNPWYRLDRRLGGPQSRSGRGGEEINSQPPPEIEL
jgi:hypothetical protein